MPTNLEIIGWFVLLTLAVLVLLTLLKFSSSVEAIEDLPAWQRNYDRMQRRNR